MQAARIWREAYIITPDSRGDLLVIFSYSHLAWLSLFISLPVFLLRLNDHKPTKLRLPIPPHLHSKNLYTNVPHSISPQYQITR